MILIAHKDDCAIINFGPTHQGLVRPWPKYSMLERTIHHRYSKWTHSLHLRRVQGASAFVEVRDLPTNGNWTCPTGGSA